MRKLTALMLALCICLNIGVMPIFAVENRASRSTTSFAGGTGTEIDPYLVATKEHLNNVRNYLSSHFKMIADIAFTEVDFAEGGAFYNDGAGWTPIGTYSSRFSGVFDGNGHVIRNLYINIEIESDDTVYAGLFGYVRNATIKNMDIEDSEITATSLSSYAYAGSIAGKVNESTITNCYNTGKVSSISSNFDRSAYAGGIAGGMDEAAITDCYNAGEISVYSPFLPSLSCHAYAGGIVGDVSYGDVTGCYNVGEIMASHNAGGIAGNMYEATITDCYNAGKIVSNYSAGGVAGGVSYGDVTDCYNTGEITTTLPLSSSAYAGGIVGTADESDVTGCYNAGDVSTRETYRAYAGGIAGKADDSDVNSCYNAGDVSSQTIYDAYAGGIAGYVSASIITITNCYNTGDIIATASAGYSIGYVHAGGIVGYVSYGDIIDCYNIGEVSAISSHVNYEGGITGSNDGTITDCYYRNNIYGDGGNQCTNEQMKKEETFVGFDFETVWFINSDDYAYPQLKENPHFKTVSIRINEKPKKLIYCEGESFDKTGMIVTAYFDNDTSDTVTDYTVSGYDSTPGTKTVAITYNGQTASFEVEVMPKEPVDTVVPGDVTEDGVVDASDLSALARHIGGVEHITSDNAVAAADVDKNSGVGAADLTKLARVVAHIDAGF